MPRHRDTVQRYTSHPHQPRQQPPHSQLRPHAAFPLCPHTTHPHPHPVAHTNRAASATSASWRMSTTARPRCRITSLQQTASSTRKWCARAAHVQSPRSSTVPCLLPPARSLTASSNARLTASTDVCTHHTPTHRPKGRRAAVLGQPRRRAVEGHHDEELLYQPAVRARGGVQARGAHWASHSLAAGSGGAGLVGGQWRDWVSSATLKPIQTAPQPTLL